MTLEVGRIGKAHGLRGDLVIHLTTDRISERTATGSRLVTDDGRELEVRKGQPYQKGFLMSFVGVSTREQAEALRGKLLFAEPLDDDDAVFAHDLIGKRVIDQDGTDHGEVLSLIDNPASDLLELSDDRLVPLTFLVEVTATQLIVDVPVGLLDDGADA